MSIAKKFECHRMNGGLHRWIAVFGASAGGMKGEKILRWLSEVDRNYGTETQVFDASRIAGSAHLVHGIKSALLAWESGERVSDSLKIEIVRHIAAERQIKEAIKKVGVNESTKKLAFVVLGPSQKCVSAAATHICTRLRRDDPALKITPEKRATIMKAYSISDAEISVADLEDLVMERIAMLALL